MSYFLCTVSNFNFTQAMLQIGAVYAVEKCLHTYMSFIKMMTKRIKLTIRYTIESI